MPTYLGTVREVMEQFSELKEIWERGRPYCASYIETWPRIEPFILNHVKVYQNNRLRTKVGRARVKWNANEYWIEMHPALFWEHFQYPQEFADTFFHELAHIINLLWTGEFSGHNKTWRQIMRSFEFKPAVTLKGEAARHIVYHKEIKKKHTMNEIDKMMGEHSFNIFGLEEDKE
jgi:predicted SprT family Zn-dependent metalloprotease